MEPSIDLTGEDGPTLEVAADDGESDVQIVAVSEPLPQ